MSVSNFFKSVQKIWNRQTLADGTLFDEEFGSLYSNFDRIVDKGDLPVHNSSPGSSSAIHVTNQATGQAGSDGLRIEVEPSGEAVINQQENQSLVIKTNNSERIVIESDGVTMFTSTPVLPTGDPTSDNQAARKAYVDAKVPAGTILMYGGTAAPSGFFICDGTAKSRTAYAGLFAAIGETYGTGDGTSSFNLPDFGGIFPRGVGTSTKLTNANGVAFSGALGTYQNDKMQGHYHRSVSLASLSGIAQGSNYNMVNNDAAVTIPVTDGVNGTPRTGAETNPANLGVNFIIKY